MKIEIEGKIHKVIYIKYNGKIPHSVVTTLHVPKAVNGPYDRPVFWDCFPNNGDVDDLYLYQAGSGGDITKLQAPQWVDGYIGRFWIDKAAGLSGQPKNYKQLSKPKHIRNFRGSSTNPFKVAEIIHNHEYCEVCSQSSIDICWKHVYHDEDDNYALKYKCNNTLY